MNGIKHAVKVKVTDVIQDVVNKLTCRYLITRFECSFTSSPLVSSVVSHLPHSFRVCFSALCINSTPTSSIIFAGQWLRISSLSTFYGSLWVKLHSKRVEKMSKYTRNEWRKCIRCPCDRVHDCSVDNVASLEGQPRRAPRLSLRKTHVFSTRNECSFNSNSTLSWVSFCVCIRDPDYYAYPLSFKKLEFFKFIYWIIYFLEYIYWIRL